MSYLFSLCSLWPAGQNYANQCRNPNAVILRFVFQFFFYLLICFFKSNVWLDPDSWSFSLLLQDSGDRYTLNSIYKDESQCPAVQYKCRRGGRGRPLVWQRQDSDTFKGRWWYLMTLIDSINEGKSRSHFKSPLSQPLFQLCNPQSNIQGVPQ